MKKKKIPIVIFLSVSGCYCSLLLSIPLFLKFKRLFNAAKYVDSFLFWIFILTFAFTYISMGLMNAIFSQ